MKALLANWHQSIEDFQFSTEEFYRLLTDAFAKRKVPDLKLSRVNLPEGGLLSAHRDYLRARRGKLEFHICAAPFGTSYFISWWLSGDDEGCLGGCLTILLPFLANFARKPTFYEEDTAVMFREAAHAAVLDVLRVILGETGVSKVEKMPAPVLAKSPLV